jgi:hypothetical protein
VCLYLGSLLEGQLPDLNGARIHRVALLTHSGEENLARMVNHQLRDVVLEFGKLSNYLLTVLNLPRDSLK